MADKLKPCPFCGGEARLKKCSWISKEWGQQIYIQCHKCGCRTINFRQYPFESKEDFYQNAIDTWNSRKET